jgi:hypothetical protein
LLGSLAKPLHRFGVVLRCALASCAHASNGPRISRRKRFSIQLLLKAPASASRQPRATGRRFWAAQTHLSAIGFIASTSAASGCSQK